MSFLDAFVGGAAEAGAGIIASNIQANQKADLAKLESELALEKAKTLKALEIEFADKQRTAKSERIQAQLGKDSEEDAKRNFQIPEDAPTTQIDSRGNTVPMSQEGTDAFNEGKGILKSAMEKRKADYLNDPSNTVKAAVETGDDDPSKLATLINDKRRTASSDAANALKQRELDLKAARDAADEKSRGKRDDAYSTIAQASLITANANLQKAIKSGDAAAINEAKTSVTAAFNGARNELSAMTDASKGAPRIEIVDGKPKGSPEDVESYNTLKKLVGVTSQSMLDKFSKKTASESGDSTGGDSPKPKKSLTFDPKTGKFN